MRRQGRQEILIDFMTVVAVCVGALSVAVAMIAAFLG